VRAEARFADLVQFVLGDTGVPYDWEYGDQAGRDARVQLLESLEHPHLALGAALGVDGPEAPRRTGVGRVPFELNDAPRVAREANRRPSRDAAPRHLPFHGAVRGQQREAG